MEVEHKVVKSVEGCTLYENGLQFSGDISFKEWEKRGSEMTNIINLFHNHLAWWIGDWIIYGQSHFKDMYTQALEGTMYSIGTLRNAVWVCRNVQFENRNPKLSFQHHYEIAKLTPEAQREFLQKAEINRWTVRELRRAVRGEHPILAESNSVNDRPEDISINAILHVEKGMTFEDWYDNESEKLKLLSELERTRTAWIAGAKSAS